MTERETLIRRLRKMRDEAQIDINTIEHWNQHVRKPHEDELPPDIIGDLKLLVAAIDDVLVNDPGHGPIAPLKIQRAH